MANVQTSIDIPAGPDRVWQLIGGFNSLPDWLPYIPSSELSDGGRVRTLANPGGQAIVERLLAFDHGARSYSYTILQSPFPVTGYVSQLRVLPAGAGASTVEWSGEFIPEGVSDDEAIALFGGIYRDGLQALRAAFAAG